MAPRIQHNVNTDGYPDAWCSGCGWRFWGGDLATMFSNGAEAGAQSRYTWYCRDCQKLPLIAALIAELEALAVEEALA